MDIVIPNWQNRTAVSKWLEPLWERDVQCERRHCVLNYDLVYALYTRFVCVVSVPGNVPPPFGITITLRHKKVMKPDVRRRICNIPDVLMYLLNIAIFWDIAQCRAYVNRRFGENYYLHLHGRNLAEQETSTFGVNLHFNFNRKETITLLQAYYRHWPPLWSNGQSS
jgi:hypothetical protein